MELKLRTVLIPPTLKCKRVPRPLLTFQVHMAREGLAYLLRIAALLSQDGPPKKKDEYLEIHSTFARNTVVEGVVVSVVVEGVVSVVLRDVVAVVVVVTDVVPVVDVVSVVVGDVDVVAVVVGVSLPVEVGVVDVVSVVVGVVV